MSTITVSVAHTTKPWLLKATYHARHRGEAHHVVEESFATRQEACGRAMDLKQLPFDKMPYLIELYVDAGCLHAVG